jgi:cysteinyl-tRNA synthetase
VLGNHDPAALRLVLLRFSPASPAALSAARLHRAEETIQRWRYKVAMWADMPSAPLVADSVSAARDALAADLDTITVLTDLHRLEVDPQIASGSKFQTFAYLDRVLGLDLRHLVGKLHR